MVESASRGHARPMPMPVLQTRITAALTQPLGLLQARPAYRVLKRVRQNRRTTRVRGILAQLRPLAIGWRPPPAVRHFRQIAAVSTGNHIDATLACRLHGPISHSPNRARLPLSRQPTWRLSAPSTRANRPLPGSSR